MILAFIPLTINAILYKKVGGYDNTKIHGILMSLSTLSAGFAFYVIYSNKAMNKRNHFTSLHGQSGGVILVLYLILAVVGFLGLHPDFGLLKTNKTVRAVHKYSGDNNSIYIYIRCVYDLYIVAFV